MAEFVYILCAATSTLCAILLMNGYRRSRTSLLLWCGLCFIGLALNNVLLVLDMMVVSQFDLSLLRGGVALAAMVLLLFGLVWESR